MGREATPEGEHQSPEKCKGPGAGLLAVRNHLEKTPPRAQWQQSRKGVPQGEKELYFIRGRGGCRGREYLFFWKPFFLSFVIISVFRNEMV